MGLGKTLSAIALVASSKIRGSMYAKDQRTEEASHGSLTRTRATLVVVPSLLILEEWKKEIEKQTAARALVVTKYHGHDRVSQFDELLPYDIVLTTYGTVATEYRKCHTNGRGRKVLYFLRWFRIILDEAHTIRSSRTAQCTSILALQAQHHWCLTGTPIQNRVEDLAPLLRFCKVPQLHEPADFQKYVAKITRKSLHQGCNVLRQVLSPICLRRTKALLDLPEPERIDHIVEFSDAEKERYGALLQQSRLLLDASVSGKATDRPKHTILQAILQLRIFCNLGTFMPHVQDMSDETYLDPDEALTLLQEEDQAVCAVCFAGVTVINQASDLDSAVLGTCSHILCVVCQAAATMAPVGSGPYQCLVCEQTVTQKVHGDEQRRPINGADLAKPRSAKLEQLIDDLKSSQGSQKSIVFSVWKRTLDVASRLCDADGIRYVRIDGTVASEARQKALDDFKADSKVSTLLMTLGTGALGLNLTAATRVHILEPQWNPAVESQAIGRVVRLGQAKGTTIIRYTVKSSVEQQIQTYQKRKLRLAAGGFSDTASQLEYEERILRSTFFVDPRHQ